MTSRIILKGVDDTQAWFGSWPYVEYDVEMERIIGSAGRFSDRDSRSPKISGYYIRTFGKVYVLFEHNDSLYFGRRGDVIVVDERCSARYSNKFFYRRFDLYIDSKNKRTIFFKIATRYLFFPPLLLLDLSICEHPNVWNFDFFEMTADFIYKRSNGLPYKIA